MNNEPEGRISPTELQLGLEPRNFLNLNSLKAMQAWRDNFNRFASQDPHGAVEAAVTYFAGFSGTVFPYKRVGEKLRFAMADTVMTALEDRPLDLHTRSTPKLAARLIFACNLSDPAEMGIWERGIKVLCDRATHADQKDQCDVRDTIVESIDTIMARLKRSERPHSSPAESHLSPRADGEEAVYAGTVLRQFASGAPRVSRNSRGLKAQ